MRYLVNSREMKSYDNDTIEHFHVPSVVLMERAATAFVDEMHRQGTDCAHVLVAAGTGNNGGDGYAIARLLLLEGFDVTVLEADQAARAADQSQGGECPAPQTASDADAVDIAAGADRRTDANRLQRSIFLAYGGRILTRLAENAVYTAVVDAVFGVGLSRDIEGGYAAVIGQLNALSGTKLAVDIASGISSDNGAILGTAFRADLTITFAYEKLGSVLWPGNTCSGNVIVRDIGITDHSFCGKKPAVAALGPCDLIRLPKRVSHSNKGSYGRLLLIAGSAGMAGAACLGGRAACCCGCGLVRVYTPEENRVIIQTALPEAILSTWSGREPDRESLSDAMKWADAIVCGPGLGTTPAAAALVREVLAGASVPVLMDADALNLIAEDTGLLETCHTDLVVTPHLGEMSRLTGESVSSLQRHLIASAEEFAERYRAVCVLKDEHTVTAVPHGQTWLNLSGNAGMATAGSGDVLSGVIGALMAQGLSAGAAAPLGVYLHGLAGDVMAEETGMCGLMAGDLPEGIRRVMKEHERRAGIHTCAGSRDGI